MYTIEMKRAWLDEGRTGRGNAREGECLLTTTGFQARVKDEGGTEPTAREDGEKNARSEARKVWCNGIGVGRRATTDGGQACRAGGAWERVAPSSPRADGGAQRT